MQISENIDFEFMMRFLDGIQKFLGDKCEILVHDFRLGYDHSIVHIINGEVSGREVGGSPRGGMILHYGQDIESIKESKVFFFDGAKGKLFKSCTTLISDENRKIIGSICVNLEVSELLMGQGALQNFLQYAPASISSNAVDDPSVRNVDDLLRYYMDQAEQLINKPMSLMSKDEKIRALDFLDERGVFKISKANILLCETFRVSKFTLYNYLEEARRLRGTKLEEETGSPCEPERVREPHLL